MIRLGLNITCIPPSKEMESLLFALISVGEEGGGELDLGDVFILVDIVSFEQFTSVVAGWLGAGVIIFL